MHWSGGAAWCLSTRSLCLASHHLGVLTDRTSKPQPYGRHAAAACSPRALGASGLSATGVAGGTPTRRFPARTAGATTKRIRAGKWWGSGVQGPAKAPGTTLPSHYQQLRIRPYFLCRPMPHAAEACCNPHVVRAVHQQESSTADFPHRQTHRGKPLVESPLVTFRRRADALRVIGQGPLTYPFPTQYRLPRPQAPDQPGPRREAIPATVHTRRHKASSRCGPPSRVTITQW